jgi:5-methylcytosine-specific restriction endonuclease McrA
MVQENKYSGGIFKKYLDYLCSWLWAEKREEVLKIQQAACQYCGEKAVAVHHVTYLNVENEKLRDLKAICNGCHEHLHKAKKCNCLIHQKERKYFVAATI